MGSGKKIAGPNGYVFRDAGPDDLDRLMSIESRAHHAPWSEDVFGRELELEWSYAWLMEDATGRAVALLVFWVIHDEIHILDVAVDPDYRRRGLARGLLEHLIEIASGQGIAMMTLEVRFGNVAAQKLYESLGFERLGSRPQYYQDNGEDAWVMSRNIEES
ncbi:MAG: ribosomal protein S18-alanine N-acetyltransferase [Bradymonadaceae bacterium]